VEAKVPAVGLVGGGFDGRSDRRQFATYSAGNVDDLIVLIVALDKRRRDGVDVRLVLETVRSDGTGPDCPRVFKSLIPYVRALEWPRKSRPSHDWTSMHVKILIRDADAVS